MRTFIKNGTVFTEDGVKDGILVIEDGKIADACFSGEIPEGARVIDAKGNYVMPGFVEIHAHGGGGADFMDGTADAFETVAKTHRQCGTTTILPTTVAASYESLLKVFETYRKVSDSKSINFGGLHLEGPFISMEMKGAQNPAFIRNPEKAEVDALIEAGGDIIKKCTVAPEIPGIDYLAKKFTDNGIYLSSGHSNGTFTDIEKGFSLGIRHITHMYSNTPTVRKINQTVYAGIVEAAYYLDDMRVEFIGDGCHFPKEALKMAVKIKGIDKINLTSDAMRAAGTNASESYLGECLPENRVIIEDGVAKLPDRSFFAGSIATGDRMLRWAHFDAGLPLSDALRLLTLSPAAAVGMDKEKGSIKKGKDADVIFMDKELNVKDTFIARDFMEV